MSNLSSIQNNSRYDRPSQTGCSQPYELGADALADVRSDSLLGGLKARQSQR